MHFERNVRLAETSSDQWRQQLYIICFRENENEVLSGFSIHFKVKNELKQTLSLVCRKK